VNAPVAIEAHRLEMLRTPFPAHHISKLPKETKAQIDARKADKNLMVWKCPECGGAHHKNAVHLDYVGHAALTDRLLDTDIEWSWEPVAFNADGLPAFDRNNGLWIKLTVCGVTRMGYGSADGKTGGDAVKEIIGDALRNAAMRFGAALDLWHKGDLHIEDDDGNAASAPEQKQQEKQADKPKLDPAAKINDKTRHALQDLIIKSGGDVSQFCRDNGITSLADLTNARSAELAAPLKAKLAASPTPFGEILADEVPY